MEAKDKIVDKIAKLLRQAESVAGTPEADVFQERAFALIAKHGVDEALLENQRQRISSSLPAEAIEWSLIIKGSWAHAQMMLLNALAGPLHCEVAYYSGTPVRVLVYGMPRHIDRMKILWDLLQPQMLRLVTAARPEPGQYVTGGRVRAFRRAWIAGFASGIATRLRQQEEAAIEAAGSTALVLFKDDAARAKAKLHEANPRLRVTKRAGFDRAGYRQGQRDSESAVLNRPVSA